MGGDLVVRDATPDDAEGIARVHVASWQSAYTHAFPAAALAALSNDIPRRSDGWRSELEEVAAGSHTLVAVRDDGVVGFVHGAPARDDDLDSARVAELFAIYVAPGAWGAGAGRRLMTAFVERIRASDFSECVLWVLDDNPRARRFYEAGGWRLDGGVKEDVFLETAVSEVRYRIDLAPLTTG